MGNPDSQAAQALLKAGKQYNQESEMNQEGLGSLLRTYRERFLTLCYHELFGNSGLPVASKHHCQVQHTDTKV